MVARLHLLEGGRAVNELSLDPMRDVPQDSLVRSLRLMAPMFGQGPREDTARYAADELERLVLEKRLLIGEVTRLTELAEELRDFPSALTRLSSGKLRTIADDCEKLIAGRMEDGVFE